MAHIKTIDLKKVDKFVFDNNENYDINVFAIITNKNNIVNNFKDIVFYNNLTDTNNILSLDVENNTLCYDLTKLNDDNSIYLGISYDVIRRDFTDFNININGEHLHIKIDMKVNQTLCIGKICKINNKYVLVKYNNDYLLFKNIKEYITKYFPGIVYM